MNLTEQIEEVENQIEYENTRIASMEQQLVAHEGEPNRWYHACEFNLNKAEKQRDFLEKKLKKLLTTQKELEMQAQAALLKEQRRDADLARRIAMAEQAAERKRSIKNQQCIDQIDLLERRFVEFRRLVSPVIGEPKVFELADLAEKTANEWMQKKLQKTE